MRIEVYVDDSSGNNPGYAWTCVQTGEQSFVSLPAYTSNEAKYLAIISTLRRFGTDRDELSSDSQLVVSQISDAYKTRDARMLYLEREALRTKKPGREIRWIPRECNVVGHRLETYAFERRPVSRIDEHETTKQTMLF